MPYTIPSSVISPGAVYQPRKSKLILDQISGAIAAWSTRRLISSAPADIARGRDASTTEQDFTAAELAGTGFTDLAGAGDGFYVTLYDQIGSNNATQATAASQPKGVSSGALITDGAIPVLDFDGAGDFLAISDAANLSFGNGLIDSPFSISANIYVRDNIGFRILTKSTASQSEWAFTTTSSGNLGFYVYDNALTVQRGRFVSSLLSTSVWVHVIAVYDGRGGVNAQDGIKIFINGVRSDDTSATLGVYTAMEDTSGAVRVGILESLPALSADGRINNLIIFNRVLLDSEITKLHTALA